MLKPTDKKRPLKNDPWEVLVVGAAFFFSGLSMLFHPGPLIAVQQVYKYTYLLPSGVTAISERGAHVLGSLGVAAAAVLVWFYFYLRRSIARDTDIIDKPRWR